MNVDRMIAKLDEINGNYPSNYFIDNNELRQILEAGREPAQPCPTGECVHLWNGTLRGRRCVYCGVEELIPPLTEQSKAVYTEEINPSPQPKPATIEIDREIAEGYLRWKKESETCSDRFLSSGIGDESASIMKYYMEYERKLFDELVRALKDGAK